LPLDGIYLFDLSFVIVPPLLVVLLLLMVQQSVPIRLAGVTEPSPYPWSGPRSHGD
jgi:hypothetical protein